MEVLSLVRYFLINYLNEKLKERWKGKQHEKKLEALQEALMNDQRIVMDKLVRERNDIDRSKVILKKFISFLLVIS